MLKASLYHIQINISNPKISIPFYKDLMLFLGYEIKMEGEDYIGFTNNITDFWFIATESKFIKNGFHRKNTGLNHLAFKLSSKNEVEVFHKEFLRARNIKTLYDTPKLFPEYGDEYYAVFFEDPDRIKIEIVYKESPQKIKSNNKKNARPI